MTLNDLMAKEGLRVVLFKSRNKDNSDLDGFKERSVGFAWINVTTFNEVRIDLMESRLKHGAVLFESNIADIRCLLLDA